jgi:hypothetical protein
VIIVFGFVVALMLFFGVPILKHFVVFCAFVVGFPFILLGRGWMRFWERQVAEEHKRNGTTP